jgi:hypothetical protein
MHPRLSREPLAVGDRKIIRTRRKKVLFCAPGFLFDEENLLPGEM